MIAVAKKLYSDKEIGPVLKKNFGEIPSEEFIIGLR
jgi:hypothetical protein